MSDEVIAIGGTSHNIYYLPKYYWRTRLLHCSPPRDKRHSGMIQLTTSRIQVHNSGLATSRAIYTNSKTSFGYTSLISQYCALLRDRPLRSQDITYVCTLQEARSSYSHLVRYPCLTLEFILWVVGADKPQYMHLVQLSGARCWISLPRHAGANANIDTTVLDRSRLSKAAHL